MLKKFLRMFVSLILCQSLLLYQVAFAAPVNDTDQGSNRLGWLRAHIDDPELTSDERAKMRSDIEILAPLQAESKRTHDEIVRLQGEFDKLGANNHTPEWQSRFDALETSMKEATNADHAANTALSNSARTMQREAEEKAGRSASAAARERAAAAEEAMRKSGASSMAQAKINLQNSTQVRKDNLNRTKAHEQPKIDAYNKADREYKQAKQDADEYEANHRGDLDYLSNLSNLRGIENDKKRDRDSKEAAKIEAERKIKEDEDAIKNAEKDESDFADLEKQMDKDKADTEAEADKLKNSAEGKDIHNKLSKALKGNMSIDNSRQFDDDAHTNVQMSAEDKKMYDAALEADITMVILGSVTTRLLKCPADKDPKRVPDVLMAANAGKAFVAGEVAEYTDLVTMKSDLNTLMMQIKGDPNDRQRAALVTLRDGFRRMKEISSQKKTIRQGAAIAYTEAAKLANEEARQAVLQAQSCSRDIRSKTEQGISNGERWVSFVIGACSIYGICVAACSGPQFVPCVGMCESDWQSSTLGVLGAGMACAAAYLIIQGQVDNCKGGRDSSLDAQKSRRQSCEDRDANDKHRHEEVTELPAASTTVSTKITRECHAKGGDVVTSAANSGCDNSFPYNFTKDGMGPYPACNPESDDLYKTLNVSCEYDGLSGIHDPNFYETTKKFTSISPRKNYLTMINDFIFSSAHAGLLSAMGVSKDKVVEFVRRQSPIFADALDTQLSAPYWRAIAWAGLAKLVEDSISTTDGMMLQIDADIKKIQAILDQMDIHIGLGGEGKTPFKQSTNFAAVPGGVSSLPCLAGSGSDGCTKLSTVFSSNNTFLELSASVRGSTARVINGTEGLDGAGSVTAATMARMNTMVAGSGAIKADLLKRQKLLEKLMKQRGTEVDINKEVSRFGDRLKGITKSGLSAVGSNAQEMRSMMSGANANGSLSPDAKKALGDLRFDVAGKNGKGGAGGAGARSSLFGFGAGASKVTGSGSGSGSKNGDGTSGSGSNTNLGKDGDPNAKGADGLTDAERAALAAGKGKGGTDAANSGDIIHDDNGFTLWEVITNRYQKSAYPRLFKKIE